MSNVIRIGVIGAGAVRGKAISRTASYSGSCRDRRMQPYPKGIG